MAVAGGRLTGRDPRGSRRGAGRGSVGGHSRAGACSSRRRQPSTLPGPLHPTVNPLPEVRRPRPDDASCPPASQVRRRQVRGNLTEVPQCDDGGEAEAAPGGWRRGGPGPGPPGAAPARPLHLCRTQLWSGGGSEAVTAAAEAAAATEAVSVPRRRRHWNDCRHVRQDHRAVPHSARLRRLFLATLKGG